MFDFDGTLVDTAPDLVRSANLYLKSKQMEPLSESQIRSEIGMGLRRFIVEIYPEKHKDEAFRKKIEDEFIAIYEKEFLSSPRLFEGVREFLYEFDGQVAIVSNKRERFIKPILKKLGLDTIPWVRIVGGDTYSAMKPHPEPFMRVIEAAGVSPEEALMVGDGHPDVEGALAVGCPSVVVGFGYTPTEELISLGGNYAIESYDELLPLINRIT
jgi:phosphoglycolate phosphatase